MHVYAIFGPPGTGKTTELAAIAGAAAAQRRVLFLSYTRAAAAEAASRFPGTGSSIKTSTLHSMAFNAFGMTKASVVDLEKIKSFSKLTGYPFKGVERNIDEEQIGDEYRTVLSYAKNMMIRVNEAYDHFGRPGTLREFERFWREYDQWKKTYGYADFDDMLLNYANAPLPPSGVPPVVILDEAQDCTPLQWKVFERLVAQADAVFVAGDDDQAIYEWNGADPHGMIRFAEQHHGSVRVLAQSHRLPRLVFTHAQALIRKISIRVDKEFKPRPMDGAIERWRDLDKVLDHLHEVAPDGALILVRDRFKLEEVKRHLNRELTPYEVYGGHSPWTSRVAQALRKGQQVEVPPAWVDFYRQADLSQPIKYYLSTIHSAKGREHDTVIHDLDCPTRVLANISLDPDAETRVQYVGMTRAKRQLFLCGGNPIL